MRLPFAEPMRSALLLSLLLVWLLAGSAGRAEAALDVLAGPRLQAVPAMDWCVAPASAGIEAVEAGACQLQPLTRHELGRGFDRRVFWMRLGLDNSGPVAVERWISVGHPRMAEVSLFTPGPSGWIRHDVGNLTPMVGRGEIERDFGMMPVHLEPHSRQVVWLRVWTDTSVDLSTTVWRPVDYLQTAQTIQFWTALALGGILALILSSWLLYARTRQSAYGFFALGLGAAFFNGMLTSGLLRRFAWPADYPLPSEAIAVNLLVAMLGYYGFMRSFLPQSAKYRKTALLFKGAILFTVMTLLSAVFIDYGAVVKIWNASIVLVIGSAMLVTYLAWRDGDHSAGILLLAFVIHLLLVGLRLLFSVGVLTWAPQVALIGPWIQVLSAPVVLLSLMDRTRQLQAELVRVQTESTARLNFLAQMSHELRSPLDTILGNTQLLLRRGRNKSYAAGLASIFDSGRHLLRMIDHILDYARGMSGVIRLAEEPVNLPVFMRGIEKMGRLLATQQRNICILRQSPQWQDLDNLALLVDHDHLRQIFGNLIANAARHTRDGRITLDCGWATLEQNRLRLDFAVADTGKGIALEDQQRIFRPFERVRQEGSGDGRGAGLGLSIARQLTELMGGSLSVESAPGQGACFRFWIIAKRLPADTVVPAEPTEEFDALGYLGRRHTLLLVDDNAENRAILAGLLDEFGFLVIQADSGRRAAELLKEPVQLDLVITDQFMADGDGWTVLETLSTARPEVPVILVSAAPPCPPPNWPVDRQFAAYFLRPLDHVSLLRSLGDLLGLTWTAIPDCGTEPGLGEDTTRSPLVCGLADVADFSRPTPAELQILARLVDTGQVTAIEEWAMALKERSPEHSVFADHVLSAVHALDLQALETLAGEGGSGSDADSN